MKLFSFLFCLFLVPALLTAQDDTLKTTLTEVVVTANKTETPYYSIASSVSIISSGEISARHYNNIVEILESVPGLSVVEQGGSGKMSNVFVRGSNPNHTLVLLDGVKMNDPSSSNNAYDFSSLNISDVERIEIVRGPQSTLYGSEAMAGVINIITKSGSAAKNYSLSAEAGSEGYYRGNLSLSGSFGKLNYFINGIRTASDGFSASDSRNGNTERDSYSNNGFTSKLDYSFSENLGINFLYKYSKLNSALDQSELHGDDPNYTYAFEEQILKTGTQFTLLNNLWKISADVSMNKKIGHALDKPDDLHPSTSSDNYTRGQILEFNLQNDINLLENNLVSVGLQSEAEKAYSSYVSEGPWGPYASVFPQQSLTSAGIYFQDQLSLLNSFFLSAGLRLDHNEKFGDVTTFRIAPAYFISETSTKIKFTYGTGFKAPSLFNLFDPAFGNPDLRPEKSEGWDAGFEQFFAKYNFSFGATYFSLKFRDMFGFDSSFRTVNISSALSRGIEIYMALSPVEGFNLNMNYTYTDARDKNTSSEDFDKLLLRRPLHQFNMNASYHFESYLKLNLGLSYTGEREDKDFSVYPAQRIPLSAYTLADFSASYDLMKNITLTGKVTNLFDVKYEEVLYYGTAGRAVYFGVILNY